MIVAVIPAMNQPAIGSILSQVSRYVDHMIVVDEVGAQIDTGKLAANCGAAAVYSRGKCLRAAVELGWAHTSTHHDVVTLDGDGSNRPRQIPDLLNADGDVVVGSRFLKRSLYVGSHPRRFGSWVYGKAASYLTGLPISDFGGGFRLYRDGAARRLIGSKAKGHAYQAEVLAKAHRLGMSISEVPVTYLSSQSTLDRKAMWEAVGTLARLGLADETASV